MLPSESKLLQNAPLKEVIFEVHWELDFIADQKLYVDNGFEVAVMNFRNVCEHEFKEFELLAPAVIPFTLLNNNVTHRFYKQKGSYPIFQMGPGVFSVNDDNKNYSWDDFKKMILKGIEFLRKSFTKELIPSRVELRYIDAVVCSVLGDTNKFDFLRKNLHVNAESYKFIEGELTDINFTKKFFISEDSDLSITVATGKERKTAEDVIIWHTFVNNKHRMEWDGMNAWLDEAHLHCSKSFKKMVSPELYEYFS